jgi:hypothetical protein
MIEAARLGYSAHSWSGALNTAASLHFLAISDRGDTLDFKPHQSPMQHELVDDPWVPEDGMLALRDARAQGDRAPRGRRQVRVRVIDQSAGWQAGSDG